MDWYSMVRREKSRLMSSVVVTKEINEGLWGDLAPDCLKDDSSPWGVRRGGILAWIMI